MAEIWPAIPHQICQLHALCEAGRLIYNADQRVKTDMRIRMQQRTHEYRHNLHKRQQEAHEKNEETELTQLHILEDYAAMVEGALNMDGLKPFGYAGLAMQEALASIKSMRAWVLEAEHIFDGSWAKQPEEITNAEVGRRFDAYLARLSCFLAAKARTEDEQLRLGHLLKVLTHVRPGLVHCYERADFPRTNNEMERTIRAVKMHYRRITGRKNWNTYLLRYGRCVVYQEWWLQQPDGVAHLQTRLQQVASSSWRQVRQETRDAHQEQLNRFRHRPLNYLSA